MNIKMNRILIVTNALNALILLLIVLNVSQQMFALNAQIISI